MEKALEEIIEKFKETQANYVLEKDLENKKNEEERTCAQEMRTAAMETYAESKKRKGDLEEAEGKKKRRRNSGNETVAYLREKFELEFDLRSKEAELKLKEHEAKASQATQQDQTYTVTAKTNGRYAMQFMEQQQMQSQAMMAVIEKLSCKKD